MSDRRSTANRRSRCGVAGAAICSRAAAATRRLGVGVMAILLLVPGQVAVPIAVSAPEKIALVIGNSAYAHIGRLPNPASDAADMEAALGRLGFEVASATDVDLAGLNEALRAFARRSAGVDVALVFYAGHGMEMDGVNYLLPVDARLERDTDVAYETVPLERVLRATEGAALRVVILDACRNNPLAAAMQTRNPTRSMSRGAFGALDERHLGDEMLVAYAAAEGTVAEDGTGRNSPYTTKLLAHLEQPLEIGTLFRRVRAGVLEATDGRQRPHEYQSLLQEHYLSGTSESVSTPSPLAGSGGGSDGAFQREVAFWEVIRDSAVPADFREFLRLWPNGALAPLAANRLAKLRAEGALTTAADVSALDLYYEDEQHVGRATLAEAGGANVGFNYRILRRGSAGEAVEVDPDTLFRSGDRIRFALEPNTDGFLYVVQQGSSGRWSVLFPHPQINGGRNDVARFRTVTIPPADWFRFDDTAGTERVFVYLSRERVNMLPGFRRSGRSDRVDGSDGHGQLDPLRQTAGSGVREGAGGVENAGRRGAGRLLRGEPGRRRAGGLGGLRVASPMTPPALLYRKNRSCSGDADMSNRSGRAGAARVAFAVLGLAILVVPIIASAQVAQNGVEREPVRGRDLVFDSAGPETGSSLTIPRGYAVVIGVGEYRNLDESQQLLFSQSDAEAMYRVLISHEGGAFPAENVRMLTGEQATLENIRYVLEEWLPAVATPADRVVVYFAGHGLVKNGRGYLAPWDVDPSRLEDTAYPMAALGDVMANRVEANWKVLLTDACHSDRININAETTNAALDLQFSSLPKNFLTLTAAREREQSYEDSTLSTGFGFFTYFLTQAWQGYADDDPCDGRITADEVIEYVRSNVRRLRQGSPTLSDPDGAGATTIPTCCSASDRPVFGR